MHREAIFLSLLAVVCFCGMQSPDPAPTCLWETNSTCTGYTAYDQCTEVCKLLTFGPDAGTYMCVDQNNKHTTNGKKVTLNNFSTVIEVEDFGFCVEGPQQNFVWCTNEALCNSSCGPMNMGVVCGPGQAQGAGLRVRPEEVNPWYFCPFDCFEF
jgi:hypothetical protein